MRRSIDYYGFALKHTLRKLFHSIKKPQSFVISIILWVCVVLFILWNNIYNKLYSADYLVNKVHYTKDSLQLYNDPWMYSFISLSYLCRYYFDITLFGNEDWYESQIKEQYPFIDTITIQGFNNNTLVLDIKFKKPTLRFLYKDESYWAYNDHNLILLGRKDELWYGVPLILLPIYLNDSSESIKWLLYNIDINKMLYDLIVLKTIPLSWSITYIPGWDKYIFRNSTIRIYFNAKKNINQQLLTLFTLMNQYKWFGNLKQIDVGSLDNPIVK